jgi:Bifunctional DNA primase/polymerase, N-terminal/AAA domain
LTADPQLANESPALRAALEYAEALGARVVPVHCMIDGRCSCGQADCSRPAKHPTGKWSQLASADPVLVRAAFARYPRAGVGIATGVASGLVVIDIDGPQGEATLAALEARYGKLPPCPTVRTTRGRHLYFAAGTAPIPNRAGDSEHGLGKGIDIRGEGGFVVAPPSVHESGRPYAWELGLATLLPPPLPPWIVALTSEPPPARAQVVTAEPPSRSYVGTRADKWAEGAIASECAIVRQAQPGHRNDRLNTAAFNLGTLVGGGRLELERARGALLDAALACKLGRAESLRTIESGLRSGMKADTRSAPTRDLPGYTPPRGNGSAANNGGAWEPEGPSEATVEPTPTGLHPRFNTAQLFSPLPSQRWIVPGLQIGPGRPTLIAGYGASAKTLAAHGLELAVASGRPAWNHFETGSPGRVLHIDYEQGYYATAKRYQRLALGHEIHPAELGNRLRYIELPRAYLDKREHEDAFLTECEGFDLVVIDALRGAAPHTDENDSAFRGAVDLCTYISQRTSAAVVLLHHAAKPKESHATDARTLARGSSAIFDACGCVLNFVARQNNPARLVTQVKMPAEAEGGALEPFELLVEDIAIDGEPKAGVRVVWRLPEIVDVSEIAESNYQRDAKLVIKAVQRNPGRSSNAIVARCGVPRARALEVLKALAEEGRIEVTSGKNKAKFYRVPESYGAEASNA